MNQKLKMSSRFIGEVMLELEISSYVDNNRMYIGLIDDSGEPFADMTVNIDSPCPDYCGYVDVNNCPELVDFIEKHELGEFTGLMGQSGFCSYPLYLFNVEKLREVAPESMEQFERRVMGITPEKGENKQDKGMVI